MNNCYFIIRHGESVLNEKKCHQGWIPNNPLTEKGKLQAKEVAIKLEDQKIELLYASPLLRTKQTAKIIANHLHLPIIFSSNIKDFRRCKKHEGLHISQYSVLPDYLLWKEKQKKDPSFCLPEGESLEYFNKRVVNFAKKLDRQFQNKNIAVVTHEGVAYYLIQCWQKKAVELESLGNAQIIKIIPQNKV